MSDCTNCQQERHYCGKCDRNDCRCEDCDCAIIRRDKPRQPDTSGPESLERVPGRTGGSAG